MSHQSDEKLIVNKSAILGACRILFRDRQLTLLRLVANSVNNGDQNTPGYLVKETPEQILSMIEKEGC